MTDMGNQYNWSVRPRPYDANVLAISHMYLDLYSLIGDPQMIDKTVYCLDAGFDRSPGNPMLHSQTTGTGGIGGAGAMPFLCPAALPSMRR
jgi:hypothetical protein